MDELTFLGNPVRDWAAALGIAVAIVATVALLKRVLIRRIAAIAQRTQTHFDDSLIAAAQRTRLAIVALPALWFATQSLVLPDKAGVIIKGAASLAMILQIGLWLAALFDFWVDRSRQRARAATGSDSASLSALNFLGKLLLWSLLLLMALDNLGINVTAMVAGLGVGGIAVALAVQNILGDLFASLSIVIDKPFEIGDFIIADDYMGSVEHVGLKTTRVRSLGGEQIIFSNSDLLKSRLRNYKRMRERRVLFGFGILFETPAEKLEQVAPIVRRIIEAEAKVRFERAHFLSIGEWAYQYEVVYWVLDPDYNLYMDIQQRINLAMVRELDRQGIGFAYPARKLHAAGPLTVARSGKPATTEKAA